MGERLSTEREPCDRSRARSSTCAVGEVATTTPPIAGMSGLEAPTALRRGRIVSSLAAAASLLASIALAACGSQTKTVGVYSAPPPKPKARHIGSATTTTSTTTTAGSGAATETTTATETSTAVATSSRTSSAPAFVEQEDSAHRGALGAAVAVVEREGYTPTSTAQYHPSQTLRVLTAQQGGGSGADRERAFFFVDGRYIGTDASRPSASIAVVSQGDTEVVLDYSLFDQAEEKVGEAEVQFQLDDGELTPLQPIPPAQPAARSPGRL
jgi:LppP/LprE lipoprotein